MVASPDTFRSLTSRHLDGELSADEQAQLYRLMMRDPRKRAAVEQTRELDAAAGKALHALLDAPSRPIAINTLPRRRTHRWLWAQLLATAALLLLAMGVWQLLAVEKQVSAGSTESLADLAAAAIHAPQSAAPQPSAAAAFRSGDDGALAMEPPVMPNLSASDSIAAAAAAGEKWWRKPRMPLLDGPSIRSASMAVASTTSVSSPKPASHAAMQTAEQSHGWPSLLDVLDPTGHRFDLLKQAVGAVGATRSSETSGSGGARPVVNSVSGEL